MIWSGMAPIRLAPRGMECSTRATVQAKKRSRESYCRTEKSKLYWICKLILNHLKPSKVLNNRSMAWRLLTPTCSMGSMALPMQPSEPTGPSSLSISRWTHGWIRLLFLMSSLQGTWLHSNLWRRLSCLSKIWAVRLWIMLAVLNWI